MGGGGGGNRFNPLIACFRWLNNNKRLLSFEYLLFTPLGKFSHSQTISENERGRTEQLVGIFRKNFRLLLEEFRGSIDINFRRKLSNREIFRKF